MKNKVFWNNEELMKVSIGLLNASAAGEKLTGKIINRVIGEVLPEDRQRTINCMGDIPQVQQMMDSLNRPKFVVGAQSSAKRGIQVTNQSPVISDKNSRDFVTSLSNLVKEAMVVQAGKIIEAAIQNFGEDDLKKEINTLIDKKVAKHFSDHTKVTSPTYAVDKRKVKKFRRAIVVGFSPEEGALIRETANDSHLSVLTYSKYGVSLNKLLKKVDLVILGPNTSSMLAAAIEKYYKGITKTADTCEYAITELAAL